MLVLLQDILLIMENEIPESKGGTLTVSAAFIAFGEVFFWKCLQRGDREDSGYRRLFGVYLVTL